MELIISILLIISITVGAASGFIATHRSLFKVVYYKLKGYGHGYSIDWGLVVLFWVVAPMILVMFLMPFV